MTSTPSSESLTASRPNVTASTLRLQLGSTCQCLLSFRSTTRPAIVGRPALFLIASTVASAKVLVRPHSVYPHLSIMADQYFKDTSRTTVHQGDGIDGEFCLAAWACE